MIVHVQRGHSGFCVSWLRSPPQAVIGLGTLDLLNRDLTISLLKLQMNQISFLENFKFLLGQSSVS